MNKLLSKYLMASPDDDLETLHRKRDNALKGIIFCLTSLLIISYVC